MKVDMGQGSTSTFWQIDQRVFEYKLSMNVRKGWAIKLAPAPRPSVIYQ
jgi:hypothetical protein